MGKKIKLGDIFKAENLKERIENLIDRLSVEDAITLVAFSAAVVVIYPIVYKMRSEKWWMTLPVLALANLIRMLWFEQEEKEVKLEPGCLAITILVAYAVIYRGEDIVSTASKILSGFPKTM